MFLLSLFLTAVRVNSFSKSWTNEHILSKLLKDIENISKKLSGDI